MKALRVNSFVPKSDRRRIMWAGLCAFAVAFAVSMLNLSWLAGPGLFVVWLVFAGPLILRVVKLARLNNRYVKGDFAEVLRIANKDLHSNPKSAQAYAALATAYIGAHNSQAALEAAEKACELEDDQCRHFLLRGVAHLQQHSHEEALADINKAIELAPHHKQLTAHLLGTRAAIYAEMHRVSLAMADCNEALRLFPKSQMALLYRAFCFATERQFAKANEDLDQLEKTKMSPMIKAFLLNHRALIATGQGKFDQAQTLILEAMALMPTLPGIITTHALVLFKQKRFEAAIDEFNRALEMDKYLAFAYWYRYKCFEALGHAERADLDKRTAENFGYKAFDFLEQTALLS